MSGQLRHSDRRRVVLFCHFERRRTASPVVSSEANAVSGVEKSHHLILLAFTTPGILKDVFFLIGVSLKGWTRAAGEKVTEESALAVNEISWACLSQIQGMSIVLNLGFAEHLEASALRSKNPDYEDNLLLATAQNAKVDYIITKGKGLLANDVVSAITPAEYVAMRG
ncbi:MAG: hypothetical protein DBY20_09130 [Coriobacteriia bacterium]|nr:MAG: hypothetical protein DBY20_09130 [Coriobacteriia bacterium]